MVYTVVSFFHQSQNISFSDWVSLFTLCLAPLIVHIAAGVPSPVYLCKQRPRWHDRIGHFNPTSILWRYFTIVDRRVRTRPWTASSMSAANALFWTSDGWDGSEQMIERSAPYRVKELRRTHMNILSVSALSTIVVTIQGVQATFELIGSIAGDNTFRGTLSISSLFFPLATFGLLRLPAAFWLAEEDIFRSEDDSSTWHNSSSTGEVKLPTEHYSWRSWRGIATRAFFQIVPLLLWTVSFMGFIPSPGQKIFYFTSTAFCLSLFYLMFFSVTNATLAFYILYRRSTTTVLPCVATVWYKIYTGILFAMMLLVFVVAAWETRRTPCGRFTTWGPDVDDVICGYSTQFPSAPNSTNFHQ